MKYLSLLPSGILTIICIALLLPNLVSMRYFVEPNVRAALAESVQELSQKGYWLIALHYDYATVTANEVCIHWQYNYRGGSIHTGSTPVTTCHS